MDGSRTNGPDAKAVTSQALVVLADGAPLDVPRRCPPRSSEFLAQLIGIVQDVPQSRERRRADPGEASAAYRRTLATV